MLLDPPLLKVEVEASTAYLSMLQHTGALGRPEVATACTLEERLVRLCVENLQRFESGGRRPTCARPLIGLHLRVAMLAA